MKGDDPHVVALNYKIEHYSSVDYDKACPLDHSNVQFSIAIAAFTEYVKQVMIHKHDSKFQGQEDESLFRG